MNNYKITLDGCGDQGLKEITVALPVKAALALAQWDLFQLDCCGGPDIRVEVVEEDEPTDLEERVHYRDNYRHTACGLVTSSVLTSRTRPHVDCPECLKEED